MSETARSPLPSWLRVKLPGGKAYQRIKARVSKHALNTVCEEARCPNLGECWNGGTATFMILGEACTRGCRFCSVPSAARPAPPDPLEPGNLAAVLSDMKLDYAVITTVCRDDLADQGASHIADCIETVKSRVPGLLIELLVQDFRGDLGALRRVLAAGPDVLAHNIETVERLTPFVRDAKAGYRRSLEVLRSSRAISPSTPTKSSLMLGLGETESEIRACLEDLLDAGTEILTLGQYLRPSREKRHLPVSEFVTPEHFDVLAEIARGMGFKYVAAGPFVRSSYRAGELFLKGGLPGYNQPQEAAAWA